MNLLTVQAAAARLGCSDRLIRHLIKVGTLKATRFGPAWMLRSADVEAARTRPGRGRPRKRKG